MIARSNFPFNGRLPILAVGQGHAPLALARVPAAYLSAQAVQAMTMQSCNLALALNEESPFLMRSRDPSLLVFGLRASRGEGNAELMLEFNQEAVYYFMDDDAAYELYQSSTKWWGPDEH